jgi:crossover junction endodeoxyribonuclease RuvC
MTVKPRRIIGLDPGTIRTGYGIVDYARSRIVHVDNGLASAPKSKVLAERLHMIYSHLHTILTEFRPDVAVVENVFFHKNVKAALSLGHARGVILAVAAAHGIPIVEYSATHIKKTVTGRGRADKYQVQMMVKTLLGLPEVAAEDASDALAMAICHCHHGTENFNLDSLTSRPSS